VQKRNRPWFYYFITPVLRFLIGMVFRLDLRGFENAPSSGGFVIAISHSSFIDPVVVGVFMRRDVSPMAKTEAFNYPILGGLIRAYGAFPVRRGQVDMTAMKTALRFLQNGIGLIIAPEGHRSETGNLQQGREGAIILSLRTGAPILPVAVWGGKPVWKNLIHLRRTDYSVRVGHPVQFRLADKATRAQVSTMSDELMYYIAQMMPAEIRGYYADLEKFTPRYLLPTDSFEPVVVAIPMSEEVV
jgi:1-acyl-sn-glycerol-3-phosphate acyltransferase